MERLTKKQCREKFNIINKSYYNIGEIFSLKKKYLQEASPQPKNGKMPDLYIVINSVNGVNLQANIDNIRYQADCFVVYEDGTVSSDGPWDDLTNAELKEIFIRVAR